MSPPRGDPQHAPATDASGRTGAEARCPLSAREVTAQRNHNGNDMIRLARRERQVLEKCGACLRVLALSVKLLELVYNDHEAGLVGVAQGCCGPMQRPKSALVCDLP